MLKSKDYLTNLLTLHVKIQGLSNQLTLYVKIQGLTNLLTLHVKIQGLSNQLTLYVKIQGLTNLLALYVKIQGLINLLTLRDWQDIKIQELTNLQMSVTRHHGGIAAEGAEAESAGGAEDQEDPGHQATGLGLARGQAHAGRRPRAGEDVRCQGRSPLLDCGAAQGR